MALYCNYCRCLRQQMITGMLFVAALAFSLLLQTPAFSADASPQILTGMQAQKSPQADLVLVYEKALIFDGVNAASKYMTPKMLDNMKEMIKQYGSDGFRDFQTNMRNAPMGEERRKQIEKVAVDGDRAILTARSAPNAVDEIPMLRMKDGWKIAVRGE